LFGDPLHQKMKAQWLERPAVSAALEDARKQG
jgi:hypothetical protein